jgi:DNA-binding transcriptional LysR family regulator
VELRHLRYFVAVAEELHFGRAAARLHMAQPPLSQQIRKLEDELGVQLFYRTKRRVELTDAGRMFLEEARLTIEQAEQTARVAERASRGQVGRLTVGFASVTLYGVLPRLVKLFRARSPDVELILKELYSPDQITALQRREIQVGVLQPPVDEELLASTTVARESMVVVLAEDHPLSRLRRIPGEKLAGEPFLLFPRDVRPQLYDQVINYCRDAGFSPNVVHETSPQQTIVGLVAAGIGLSLVPACLKSIKIPGVTYRPLTDAGLTFDTVVAWRRDDLSPALMRFLDAAAEVGATVELRHPAR